MMDDPARWTADVFVVVGTDHHPFDRLCAWVDTWARAHPSVRCFIQSGTSRPPTSAGWAPSLTHYELTARMAQAAAVVCHGGPGAIMDAREAERMPIVVPRRRALGEHVDDHQVRFAQHFATVGLARLATDEHSLATLLDAAVANPLTFRISPSKETSLVVEPFERAIASMAPRRSLPIRSR